MKSLAADRPPGQTEPMRTLLSTACPLDCPDGCSLQVTVDDGRLWVMGDHRSASADSKVHMGDQYSGTIGVDDVIGKAAMIVWPVSRFGMLDSPDIQGTETASAGATVAPSAVLIP